MPNPLAKFGDGRDRAGRFAKGNVGGPGNPHGRAVARLRQAVIDTVTDDDFAAIIRTLVDAAKAGEPWAVKELLDRTIGKPVSMPDDAPEVGGPGTTFVVPPPRVIEVAGKCFDNV